LGDARSGEEAGAGEVLVDGAGGASAFVDGPDDEGLAAATIAGDKHALKVGGKFAVLADESLPVAARVLGFEAEHFADFKFWPHETGGEQHEVGRPFFFGAFHFAKGRDTFDRFGPIDLDGFHRDDVAAVIADKFLGEDVVRARVVAVFGFVFGVRIVEAIIAAGGQIRQDRLYKLVGFSKSKLSRHLAELEKRGIIERERVGRTNVIRLTRLFVKK